MKFGSPLTGEEARDLIDTLRKVAEASPMSENEKKSRAKALEEDGYRLLYEEKKPQEAFGAFDEAARLFKGVSDHQQAAACFASAGSCWLIQCGEELLWNAASRYEYAGDEAVKYNHYEYAKFLYEKSAALARTENSLPAFSRSFYKSKLSETKHTFLMFTNSDKLKKIPGVGYSIGFRSKCKYFLAWLMNSFLFLVWGYGERPFRAFCSSLFVIFLSSLTYYYSGQLKCNGQFFKPSVFDSIYLSVVTFTTLGYGDIVPTGFCRVASMVEALSGLFLAPLFLVALVRKYVGTF
ncbi:MAG: Ion channel [Elusimicrobia bacterium ADurb.Bin231]|nr:MAG: Ion channel [Elusimicrobia bacterium ADurb.Bin231]